jgi:hypothetical protein
VRTTDRGRYQLHAAGVKRMGQRMWEQRQTNAAWIMKGFDVTQSIGKATA